MISVILERLAAKMDWRERERERERESYLRWLRRTAAGDVESMSSWQRATSFQQGAGLREQRTNRENGGKWGKMGEKGEKGGKGK